LCFVLDEAIPRSSFEVKRNRGRMSHNDAT
jgi:hypothetical protein